MSFEMEPSELNAQPADEAGEEIIQNPIEPKHENQLEEDEAITVPTAQMSFLHPSSLVFDFLAHVKTYLLSLIHI